MSKRPPRKKKEEVIDVLELHQKLMEDNMEKDEKLREQFPANVEGSKEFHEFNEDIGLGVNQIHCGDTWETMNKLKDKSIDFIMTSPPYLASIRKDNHKYPGAKNQIKDNQSVEEYLDWMSDIFKQYERVLNDDGVMAFNFSYTTFNPSLPYDLINRVFKDTGLRIYDTVAWKKKSAVPLA